jgi:hypothetical protein
MSRTKKILFVVSMLFSAESICLPFLTYGTASWTIRHNPPLLKAASHRNTNTFKLESPAKTEGRSVLEISDEPTPRSVEFLTANAKPEYRFRSSMAAPHHFRTILAPKVSRYIAKSVLNI